MLISSLFYEWDDFLDEILSFGGKMEKLKGFFRIFLGSSFQVL
jgi:hypothetical protein